MKQIAYFFLLMTGLILAASESEYFIGNIIGLVLLYVYGGNIEYLYGKQGKTNGIE